MLKDKIVFVTGASSGIGTACAKQFAKAGAKLLLCARRIDLLNTLASQLHDEYGVDVFVFQLDVRYHGEIKEAIKTLPNKWKNVDVLVNNAGLAAGLDLIQEGNVQD